MTLSTAPGNFSPMNKLILGENRREGFPEEVMSELPGNVSRDTAGRRGEGFPVEEIFCAKGN